MHASVVSVPATGPLLRAFRSRGLGFHAIACQHIGNYAEERRAQQRKVQR